MAKQLLFRAVKELVAGDKWRSLFDLHWQAYERWYLSEGERERPSYLSCFNMFQTHMPELLGTYRHLCDLGGGGDLAARMLSLYRPPAYITGCSQAVLSNSSGNMLVRNYDYPPELCEGTILYTHWNDKRVIAMSDCLWGVLDGINDSGLALSLAFGGRKVVGDGFGAPIILRYILEFCETVKDAADVLCRVPTHMSYNITVTDRSGRYITAMIAPDRKTSIKRSAVATNHQKKKIEWHAHALASETLVRERQLSILVADARMTEERLISAFTDAPLFRRDYRRGLGTVYSAAYWPGSGQARFFWPSHRLDLSFENFVEQTVQIEYDQKRKRSGHGSQV